MGTYTALFDDDGNPIYPIRYDATLTLEATECLRLWEILETVLRGRTDLLFADTADWATDMLERLKELPISEIDIPDGMTLADVYPGTKDGGK